MDAARRAQNTLLRYLPGEPPESLADFVKHFRKEESRFPQLLDLKPLISPYWVSTGRDVKVYRDQSQHFRMVASQASITRNEVGNVIVGLGLPSIDHDAQPEPKLDFSRSVNAFTFIESAFGELVGLVSQILRWRFENLGLEQFRRLGVSFPTIYVAPPTLSAAMVPTPEEVLKRLDAACRQE